MKYTLTTPEAEPAVKPWLHSPILRYGLVQSVSTNHGVQRVLSNSASAQVTFLCCCLAFFLYTAFSGFKFAFINVKKKEKKNFPYLPTYLPTHLKFASVTRNKHLIVDGLRGQNFPPPPPKKKKGNNLVILED